MIQLYYGLKIIKLRKSLSQFSSNCNNITFVKGVCISKALLAFFLESHKTQQGWYYFLSFISEEIEVGLQFTQLVVG